MHMTAIFWRKVARSNGNVNFWNQPERCSDKTVGQYVHLRGIESVLATMFWFSRDFCVCIEMRCLQIDHYRIHPNP
jgi:hypothetical protein